MQKIAGMAAALACATAANAAQPVDTTKTYQLQDVQVTSIRATKTTPVAYKNFDQAQIKKLNYGQDVPYLLSSMPSVTMSSDAGNAIGYTSIRVRGVDPTRVNITVNGIPQNDAESNGLYWVNMGDFASSAKDIQMQRGVGTSTNGSGAFGASVNMATENIPYKPYIGFDASAGSYYSHKETLRFGTGLFGGHWGLQGRLSNIGTKGYLRRADAKLNSYFLQAGYFGNRTVVKFVTFNGLERTYHAWNYASKYEQSLYGRRYNSCGEYYDEAGNVHYYDGQTDNYHQQNYQLIWNQNLSRFFDLSAALHYTKGQGYYEEYKSNKNLQDYGLSDEKYKTDLIRQKKMDNDFYGAVASLIYNNRNGLKATLGGGWNKYDGDHFGLVTWVKAPVKELLPDHKYYDNNALKSDFNVYGKVDWEFVKNLNGFVDLQYRHVGYRMQDPEDDAWADQSGKYLIHDDFDFFNPKAGLNYRLGRWGNLYVSYGMSHKEPTRNDYQDNYVRHLKAEKLQDVELGYRYESPVFSAGVNLYYMYYNHQYVLTGAINEIGEMIASNENSGKSYRSGIELEAAWKPVDWFRWDANATFADSKAKDWTVTATNEEGKKQSVNLGDTHLSFTPDVIVNSRFTFMYKGFSAAASLRYVGEQYLTNTGFKSYQTTDDKGKPVDVSMMLADHFTTDLDLNYHFNIQKWGLKDATVGIVFYNLFSKEYDNNGWAAPSFKVVNGKAIAYTDGDLYEAGFAPSAPFNCMAHLSLNF